MKSLKSVQSIAICGAVLLISPFFLTNAYADTTPSPAPSVSSDPYKAAMEQFKRDRDAFMSAMRDREIKIRDINMAFKVSVDKANNDARISLATAATPLQKTAVAAARKSAIDLAINSRDTAIAALGQIPMPPTEPERPARPLASPDQKVKSKR